MAIHTEQAPLDQFCSKTTKGVNHDQCPFVDAFTKLKGHNKKLIGTKAQTYSLPPSINPVFSAPTSQGLISQTQWIPGSYPHQLSKNAHHPPKLASIDSPKFTHPNPPPKQKKEMGCAPSRPSQSFYQEFFVEYPEKRTQGKVQGKRIAVGKLAKQSQKQAPPLKEPSYMDKVNRNARKPKHNRTLTHEEEIARADLRIYAEEMKANRILIMNCVLDGKDGSVF